jgi:hypothetical protein
MTIQNRTNRILLHLGLAAWASTLALVSVAQTDKGLPATAPASPFTWGGDLRLRNEYFNNAVVLNENTTLHEQDFYRSRLRLWASYDILPGVSCNARLAAEPRTWTRPSFVKQHPGLGTEWRYGIFDMLNAKWSGQTGDWNLTATAGRQDIQIGETGQWWLIADGTPGDGSWTSFFDAVRFTAENKKLKFKLDVSVLEQRATPDSNIDIIGSRNTYTLTEQNERGAIINASTGLVEGLLCEGYFINKSDRKVLASGDNADLYTVGARIVRNPVGNWSYLLEAAYQWGSKQDSGIKLSGSTAQRRDVSAVGANARLSYNFKDRLDNKLSLLGEYLSGDDPQTQGKDEMFDILWGRYPRWSDAYVYSYIMENGGRLGQVNNLIRLGPVWSLAPAKGTSLSLSYATLLALESVPTRAVNSSLFSMTGHNRGHLWQLVLKRQFTKAVSGLFCVELMSQGNFYTDCSTQSFMRFELATRF